MIQWVKILPEMIALLKITLLLIREIKGDRTVKEAAKELKNGMEQALETKNTSALESCINGNSCTPKLPDPPTGQKV